MGRKTPPFKNYPKMTQAAFKNYVIQILRRKSMYWPAIKDAKKAACVGRMRSKATGKQAAHYMCAHCKKFFPDKQIHVDHINGVVDPEKGFQGWDVYIDRLFCSVDDLQVLCKECHKKETARETALRKLNKV